MFATFQTIINAGGYDLADLTSSPDEDSKRWQLVE